MVKLWWRTIEEETALDMSGDTRQHFLLVIVRGMPQGRCVGT